MVTAYVWEWLFIYNNPGFVCTCSVAAKAYAQSTRKTTCPFIFYDNITPHVIAVNIDNNLGSLCCGRDIVGDATQSKEHMEVSISELWEAKFR